MTRRCVASLIAALLLASGCANTRNRPTFRLADDAPAVEPRPAGCHVETVEKPPRGKRTAVLGTLTLEWSKAKVKDEGPTGAIAALEAEACDRGAFYIVGMRALSTGLDGGFVYEAELHTLLDETGMPVNKPAAPDAGAAPTPANAS